MRLLLVNWQDLENPQSGGAEIHLFEIFGRLARRGHEVTLLCGGWPECQPRARIAGIDVWRVGTRQSFPFLARRHYRRHLASLAHDLLIEDINKVPLYTPSWGARRTAALVPHLFGDTAFQELPAPLAAAVWLAERPLPIAYRGVPFEAISGSTADDLVERGIARSQVRVIYPGIDTVHYTPAAPERAATPVFAYLGRLKRYKGVDLVIRGFAKLAHATAVLQIAGAGDYRPELERLVASLDLGKRVEFLGRVTEEGKLALLRRAWALALASPKEGWGITNLEAAACATPVVASDSPGIRESVRDGETGYLVPHGDIDAIASAFARIAGNRALVDDLGASARSFSESFTWDRSALETERHCAEILGMGADR